MTNEDELTIDTFNDLMHYIAYDWGFEGKYSLYQIQGGFCINKTYIFPHELRYKTDTIRITNPLVFEKLELFYKLLQDGPLEKVLYMR